MEGLCKDLLAIKLTYLRFKTIAKTHIEISQLIFSINLTGFYMIETLAANGLIPQHFHFVQAKQPQCKLNKQKKLVFKKSFAFY